MSRAYDLPAVVEAHRAASVGNWTRLSDMEYDAIAGTVLRAVNQQLTELAQIKAAYRAWAETPLPEGLPAPDMGTW